MMSEAYTLSILAVVAALSFALLRAATVRPTVLIVSGMVGVFGAGYLVGHVTQPAANWDRAGQVRTPAQWAGNLAAGEGVTIVQMSAVRGLAVKNSDKISVDTFDAAVTGTPGNRGAVTLRRGGLLQIAGWAADADAGAACKSLYVTIGKIRFDVPYGHPRADVAAYFNNPKYAPTGYNVQIPTAGLSKGSYPVAVECLSSDGKTLFVKNRAREVVIE